MLSKTGVPTPEDIERVTPSVQRRARGPVAVVECLQEIPCDPCAEACRVGAISPFSDINHLPSIDHEICTGCGLCISACPGLAIFVVDESYSDEEAVVRLPYEFLPRPEKGDRVTGLDRRGEPRGEFQVVRVQAGKAFDRTAVVWLAVPRELCMEIRAIVPPERGIRDEG